MVYSCGMSNPTIEQLTSGFCGEELRILEACFTRSPRRAGLKKRKPFASRDCRPGCPDANFKGTVNYVWRMLCFDFLPFAPHCCMPVTADWDLAIGRPRYEYGSDNYNAQKSADKHYIEYLDGLVKRAESNLPVTSQAGTMRWGRALGAI